MKRECLNCGIKVCHVCIHGRRRDEAMILKKGEFDFLMERMKQAIERHREGKTDNLCGCDECVKERGVKSK